MVAHVCNRSTMISTSRPSLATYGQPGIQETLLKKKKENLVSMLGNKDKQTSWPLFTNGRLGLRKLCGKALAASLHKALGSITSSGGEEKDQLNKRTVPNRFNIYCLFVFCFFGHKISVCSPGWPLIHSNLPASASWAFGLQVWD